MSIMIYPGQNGTRLAYLCRSRCAARCQISHFRVHDYEYVLTFAAMLVVALVISTQTARIRKQAADAIIRQSRSETLYRLSRRLAGGNRVLDMARIAAEHTAEVIHGIVVIFLPEGGRISISQ